MANFKLGDNTAGIKLGDRVGIAWLHKSCGACEYCISGWETLCNAQLTTGYAVDGCYAEYALGYASHLLKIADTIDSIDAARKLWFR